MNARLEPEFVEAASRALEAEELDAWLLYDLHGHNQVAAEILGMPEGTHRRHYVLLRPGADPLAVTHRIERQAWEAWPWERREYVGWEELESELRTALEGLDRVAMEISERDAVPAVDQVPAGVAGLVASFGVRVVSSAGLISRSYARWGDDGRRLHERAAAVLAKTARRAAERAARAAASESPMGEHELAAWIRERTAEEGLTGGGVIVGAGSNSALPHYTPPAEGSRTIEPGDVLLIDLWGKVAGEASAVFADQTWMSVLAAEPGDAVARAWKAVREARDGVVAFLEERASSGEPPSGADADRRAREVLEAHGFGDAILHRTGHAMDRVNHGFGPNLDSVETRDERRILPGVGFSVEPGLYFAGRWGLRSEINVHMTDDGPVVTTPDVQSIPWTFDTTGGAAP